MERGFEFCDDVKRNLRRIDSVATRAWPALVSEATESRFVVFYLGFLFLPKNKN